jgi:anti-anti-sigma factor
VRPQPSPSGTPQPGSAGAGPTRTRSTLGAPTSLLEETRVISQSRAGSQSRFAATADPTTATVYTEGTLDRETACVLLGTVESLRRLGHCQIVVDLTQLDRIDATGVRTLAALQHAVSSAGGALVLRQPVPAVQAALAASQLAFADALSPSQ